MKQVHDILSGFKTLREYTEFMEMLSEKQASGDEISRGKSDHDKSKDQKATYVSKEVKKGADGSTSETHYDQVDPSIGAEPPPEPPVPLQPGQQVVIGNKQIDSALTQPKTVKVDVSGQKDKINLKPRFTKDPNKFT